MIFNFYRKLKFRVWKFLTKIIVYLVERHSITVPVAIVSLSAQHPNNVSLQCDDGHPRFLGPRAAETPSSQQPYFDSLQVFGFGQPLSNGPLAGVILSQQQPYVVLTHVLIFRLLHIRVFVNRSKIVDFPSV